MLLHCLGASQIIPQGRINPASVPFGKHRKEYYSVTPTLSWLVTGIMLLVICNIMSWFRLFAFVCFWYWCRAASCVFVVGFPKDFFISMQSVNSLYIRYTTDKKLIVWYWRAGWYISAKKLRAGCTWVAGRVKDSAIFTLLWGLKPNITF